MLNIYLIEIPLQGFDTYDKHVVRAKDPAEVIELAQSMSADEGTLIWATTEASIHYLGDAYLGDGQRKRERGIICSSFNAG